MSKIENHTPVKIPIFYDKEMLDDVRLETINPLAKEVTNLSSKMSDVCVNLNSVDTKMSALESKVDAEIGKNQVDLKPLLQDIETHREGLIYLKNASDVLTLELKDLESKVNNSDISLLAPRVTKVENDITLLKSESADLLNKIDEVGSKIPTVDHVISDLAVMKTQYADMDTVVKNTHINIANLAQDVGRFDGGLDSLMDQCNTTEGKVTKAVTDINNFVSNVGKDIASASMRLDSLESNSSDTKTILDSLTVDVSSSKRDVEIVKDKTLNMEIIVNSNHSNLTDVAQRVINLEANSGGSGGGGSVDLTPITNRLDGHDSEIEDLKDCLDGYDLEIEGLKDRLESDKEITKFYVLPLLGQSNCVGYGELPYYINEEDNVDPRIKQLGRYKSTANGANNVDTVNKARTNYGDRFEELRPFDDCNLKVIPAVPCLDHVQNMFQHQVGGTTGFGMYLAKLILPYIPQDYGILIVPCARGASCFTSGVTGTYDSIRMFASESSIRQGVGTPLGNSNYDRVKFALSLNEQNKLLPIIWVQGEMDQGKAPEHLTAFETYFNWYKDKLVTDGLVKHLPGKDINDFRWICFGSTKWMLGCVNQRSYIYDAMSVDSGLSRMAVYDNYCYLSNKYRNADGSSPLIYARADVDLNGSFLETNRERGNGITTGTREIHFSTHANRIQLPKLMFNTICGYSGLLTLPLNTKSSRHIRGGGSTLLTDNVTFQYDKPSTEFDINSKLLVHQKWPTVTQSEKLTNRVTGTGVTLSGATSCTIVADTNFGAVMRFPDTSGGQIDLSINKAQTSFTKSIVFKPATNSRTQNSNIMSMGTGGGDTDGVIWYQNGSLYVVPDYTSARRTNAVAVNPCLVGGWSGQFTDWQHLVVTYNKTAGLFSVYLNGGLVGHVHTNTLTLNKVCVGGYNTTDLRLSGDVANYRIYDRCLSHGEVGTLWHCDMKNYL